MWALSTELLATVAKETIVRAFGPVTSAARSEQIGQLLDHLDTSIFLNERNLGSKLEEFSEGASPRHLSAVADLIASPSGQVFFRAVLCGLASDRLSEAELHVPEDLRAILADRLAELPQTAGHGIYSLALAALEPQVDYLHDHHNTIHAELLSRARREAASGGFRSTGARAKILWELEAAESSAMEVFVRSYRDAMRAATSDLVPAYYESQRRVPLDSLYIKPRIARTIAESRHDGLRMSLAEFAAQTYRSVVLGDPGGGKSTLAQKIVNDATQIGDRAEAFGVLPVPFIVQLRSYEQSRQRNALSIEEFIQKNLKEHLQLATSTPVISYLLATGQAMVVFDGLDELLHIDSRRGICAAVENFCHKFSTADVVVTSRTIGYEEAPLSDQFFETYKILEFTREDAQLYATSWFERDERLDSKEREQITTSFLRESESIQDLRSNPLLLGLLCNIYKGIRTIPRNRAELYGQCASMLFERWDAGRGIAPPSVLKADAKAALQHVAYWALTDRSVGGSDIPENALRGKLAQYLQKREPDFETALDKAAELLALWRGRAWILTDVGSSIDRSTTLYRFTHRTFLEYFAAIELVRTNPSPDKLWQVLRHHLEMYGADWTVVAQIAIQALDQFYEDAGDSILDQAFAEFSESAETPHASAVLSFITTDIDAMYPKLETLGKIARWAASAYAGSWPIQSRAPKFQTYVRDLPGRWTGNHPLLNLVKTDHEGSNRAGHFVVERLLDLFLHGHSDEAAAAGSVLLSFEDLTGISPESVYEFHQDERDAIRSALLEKARFNFWLPILGWRKGHLTISEAVRLSDPNAAIITSSPYSSKVKKRVHESLAEASVKAAIAGDFGITFAKTRILREMLNPAGEIFDSDWFGFDSPLQAEIVRVAPEAAEEHTSSAPLPFSSGFVNLMFLAFIVEVENWPLFDHVTGTAVGLNLGAMQGVEPILLSRRVPGYENAAAARLKALRLSREMTVIIGNWAIRDLELNRSL